MLHTKASKYINIICLLAAVVMVLLLPAKKEIWYDETVSMLCSKGISAKDPGRLANTTALSSADFEERNTVRNVFDATVADNANSFIYNIGLHWFTRAFGNSMTTYMLFSKICTIVSLLVFYMLCTMFMGGSIFTASAILLLAADGVFTGMSHEVRAYAMGITFASISGLYFFRYINVAQRPRYLLFTGLFAVGAVLSHFLSVYIVIVFCISFLLIYRQRFFTKGNLLSMVLPVLLIGVFFYFAWPGLQVMRTQNMKISEKTSSEGFSLWVVLVGTLRFIALNFKAVFPVFISKQSVVIASFMAIVALYLLALRHAADAIVRRNLHLLFALGISSSIFLGALCIKSGHYTSLYHRYHSFALPFSTLFTVYALYVLFHTRAVNRILKAGVLSVVFVPSCLLFVLSLRAIPPLKYNHFAVAAQLTERNVTAIQVPLWRDAFLIQTVLPQGYKIDYVRNENAPYFAFRDAGGEQKIPVIAKDN